MSVRDAELSDLYTDERGKLWRVVGLFSEPVVIVEEVESQTPDCRTRQTGGVSGAMWFGFSRIYRPPAREAAKAVQKSPMEWGH